MSKKDKLLSRFSGLPKDFTWSELRLILQYFGFEELQKGKTSGSRVGFYLEGFPPHTTTQAAPWKNIEAISDERNQNIFGNRRLLMKSSKMLQYKGYYGSIDIDPENNVLFGKVEFVRALITYEARDAATLINAFHESVDCYLELCEKQRIEPEQPFKGSLNVRIGRERHRKAWLAARSLDKSLNEYLCQALDDSFENMPTPAKRHIKISKRSSKKSPDQRKSA